jgi:hypothetical protein
MAIEGSSYLPPGVYTNTIFETQNQNQALVQGRVPTLIGTGRETVISTGNILVRGSSSTVDQRIVEEDPTGRMVSGVDENGNYIYTDYSEGANQLQVRHFPIVSGDGSGSTTNVPSSVTVSINGTNTVIISLDGANGLITLAEAPKEGDDVRVSYFFNRTDTLVEGENLSSQVSPQDTELLGSNSNFVIDASSNTLILTVDGETGVITLPNGAAGDRANSLQRVIATLNGAGLATLEADSYTDAEGNDNLILTAKGSILVGNGTANFSVGVYNNQTGTARSRTFYTQYGPIVDGSNGGVITTDTSLVTVRVNGVEVTPASVDGANGSITLALAPVVDSSIEVDYYHNTFQDQFDYIPGRDITSIDRVSLVASGGGGPSLFVQDVDFVLSEDRIVWGSASVVSAGSIQEGEVAFGSNQISSSLRDEKAYLVECSPVSTTTIPPRVLSNTFKLPFQPVDGSGLGKPTRRTDLVEVRTGVSLADALERSPATVVKVDPVTSQVVLSSAVPTNHKVFASFYYSNIQDSFGTSAYVVEVESVGASGIGTYSLSSPTRTFYSVDLESKGVDLQEVTLTFPSGSEARSGARIADGTPVSENVTVEIRNYDETPAFFFSEGFGDYFLIQGSSDTLAMEIDLQATTVDFSAPMGAGRNGNITTVVGGVLPYDAASNNTNYGATALTRAMTLTVDGVTFAEASINGVGDDVEDWVSAINTVADAEAPVYTSMSAFGAWEAKANTYASFKFRYVGDSNGSSVVATATIQAAVYLSQTDLANAVSTAITNAIANDIVNANADFTGLSLTCGVDSLSRLTFSLDSLPNLNDTYGFIEFISDTDTSFLTIAGIDYDTENNTTNGNGTQTKFGYLPVAAFSRTTLTSGELRDRLILKGRTVVGNSYYPVSDLGVSIDQGTRVEDAGFEVGTVVPSVRTSVVDAPSILLRLGWSEVDGDGIPAKTLYSTGNDQNNTISLEIDGETINITLNDATAQGNLTSITDILTDISGDLAGSATAHIEGAGIRIVNANANISSYIKVGAGTGNSSFGVTEGDSVSAVGVSAKAVVSSLMSHSEAKANFSTSLFSTEPQADAAVGYYADKAVAYVFKNQVGREYVGFESLSTGNSSILEVTGGRIATTKGNGLKIVVGSGAVGEEAYQGFVVTSDNAQGSGSANTSRLNDAVGADGIIGQTYIDEVTGLTFTLLEREGGIDYPTGADAQISFKVGTVFTSNANIPTPAIPGVSLIVSNTLDTSIGDTALVEVFNKEGNEPNLGQVYYVDFTRIRTEFNTRTFSSLADVISTYGEISPNNSLSLGALLAFSNGATAIACKQVQLEAGESSLSEDQVVQAIQDLEGEIVPGLTPSVIVPLYPATTAIVSAISNHCDIQSSLRYRSERRAVLGVRAGTQPREVQSLAQSANNTRICIVYPDLANVSYVDAEGLTQTILVGGEYVAVATALATSNPSIDSATPWTGRSIAGISSLARLLDEVDANATANAGVTVLSQRADGIKVRHGLTTNMTSVLTKTPTVIQIADDVQIRSRNLLSRYVGVKFVPQVIQQIEGRLNAFFKQLVRDQIISTYTGLSVSRDATDPTQLNVEVFYKPVYPLLYIQFTFTVQGS